MPTQPAESTTPRTTHSSPLQLHRINWYAVRSAGLRAYTDQAQTYALTADTWITFEWILRLTWWHSRHSDNHVAYATPSEAWLAEKVQCRRETISHHIHRLAAIGLLTVTARRKVRGEWQTNLYRLTSNLWQHLRRLSERLRGAPPTPHSSSNAGTASYVCAPAHTVKDELNAMIQRWNQRRQAPGEGANG